MTKAQLAPIDQANLLAGHAVAYATSFLDGRLNAVQLLANAMQLQGDLFTSRDPETNHIIDPVRLLAIAMLHTARAQGRCAAGSLAKRDGLAGRAGALREPGALRPRADGSSIPCDQSGFSAGFECGPLIKKDERT
jgi:hypothetical protein